MDPVNMDSSSHEHCELVLEHCVSMIDTLMKYISGSLQIAVDPLRSLTPDEVGVSYGINAYALLHDTVNVRQKMMQHKRELEVLVDAKKSAAKSLQSSEVEMDAEIWSRLPEELLHKVVAHLPVPAYLRFRSVCKSWEALAASEIFLANVQPQEPWFLVYDVGDPSNDSDSVHLEPIASAYSFSEQKWRRLRLPLSTRNLKPLSSSEGLICFGCIITSEDDELPEYPLVVVNPITQDFYNLPPMLEPDDLPLPWFSSVGLTVDPVTKAYKVVVIMKEPWNSRDYQVRIGSRLKIYDSVTDEWTVFPKTEMVDYLGSKEIVYCSNSHIVDLSAGAMVNLYDLPGVDDMITHLETNVQECLFAVEIGYQPMCIVDLLCILRLEPQDEDWEFLTYVPLEPLHTFFGVKNLVEAVYTYDIHQCQNILLLVVLQVSTKDFESIRRRCTLMYDMSKDEWSPQPVLNGADGWVLSGEANGLFFQPQMNAPV